MDGGVGAAFGTEARSRALPSVAVFGTPNFGAVSASASLEFLEPKTLRTAEQPDRHSAKASPTALGDEWRVHFHIPIHAQPGDGFDSTRDHLLGAMDWLAQNPAKCQHIEMETYTWEVLPPEMRSGDVVDQLVREYEWTLGEMGSRSLAPA